eukprot:PhF_6_TR43392/c0_g2_i1/m.66616
MSACLISFILLSSSINSALSKCSVNTITLPRINIDGDPVLYPYMRFPQEYWGSTQEKVSGLRVRIEKIQSRFDSTVCLTFVIPTVLSDTENNFVCKFEDAKSTIVSCNFTQEVVVNNKTVTVKINSTLSDAHRILQHVGIQSCTSRIPDPSQVTLMWEYIPADVYERFLWSNDGHIYSWQGSTLAVGYLEAKRLCTLKSRFAMRGYLATVTTEDEELILANTPPVVPNVNQWICASYSAIRSVWQWDCGPEKDTVIYNNNTKWSQGYPQRTPFCYPCEDYVTMGPSKTEALQTKWQNKLNIPFRNFHCEFSENEQIPYCGRLVVLLLTDTPSLSVEKSGIVEMRSRFSISKSSTREHRTKTLTKRSLSWRKTKGSISWTLTRSNTPMPSWTRIPSLTETRNERQNITPSDTKREWTHDGTVTNSLSKSQTPIVITPTLPLPPPYSLKNLGATLHPVAVVTATVVRSVGAALGVSLLLFGIFDPLLTSQTSMVLEDSRCMGTTYTKTSTVFTDLLLSPWLMERWIGVTVQVGLVLGYSLVVVMVAASHYCVFKYYFMKVELPTNMIDSESDVSFAWAPYVSARYPHISMLVFLCSFVPLCYGTVRIVVDLIIDQEEMLFHCLLLLFSSSVCIFVVVLHEVYLPDRFFNRLVFKAYWFPPWYVPMGGWGPIQFHIPFCTLHSLLSPPYASSRWLRLYPLISRIPILTIGAVQTNWSVQSLCFVSLGC